MTVKTLPIESIRFLDELYPRDNFDQETVNQYRQSIDCLPPIQVTHELILIDGYHRLIAYRIEQRETIDAEIEQLDKNDVLWEAVKRNSIHGLQLSLKDKKRLARTFFGNSKTQEQIANVLSVAQSTISNWTQDLSRKQDEARNERIWQLWLACHTQEEIAEKVSLTQPRITQLLDDIRNIKLNKIYIPDSLRIFDLWNFPKNDDRYGMDYPGRNHSVNSGLVRCPVS